MREETNLMADPRIKKLASTLLNHSIALKPMEHVLIRGHLAAKPLVIELIEQVYENGAYPYFYIYDDELERHLAMGFQEEQLKTSAKWDILKYQEIDAIITIIAEDNAAEMSGIPEHKHSIYGNIYSPIQQYYINNKKWVLLNYPTKSLAQKANMNSSQFEDFLLSVCNVDYVELDKALQPLKELMEKTDKVRIMSPGTDLTFSIKGMPVIPCVGEKNLPDGEIYTAPVKNSVQGTITFNVPSTYRGISFQNISLTFVDGKVVHVDGDKRDEIIKILNSDDGSSYIGEFAIGVNPLIQHPMNDILFDEKISGSIHLTPGQAYENADNGNKSSIHWDLVLIQRMEYGGGELYFDDLLIRKDGVYILPELEQLNPEKFALKD